MARGLRLKKEFKWAVGDFFGHTLTKAVIYSGIGVGIAVMGINAIVSSYEADQENLATKGQDFNVHCTIAGKTEEGTMRMLKANDFFSSGSKDDIITLTTPNGTKASFKKSDAVCEVLQPPEPGVP